MCSNDHAQSNRVIEYCFAQRRNAHWGNVRLHIKPAVKAYLTLTFKVCLIRKVSLLPNYSQFPWDMTFSHGLPHTHIMRNHKLRWIIWVVCVRRVLSHVKNVFRKKKPFVKLNLSRPVSHSLETFSLVFCVSHSLTLLSLWHVANFPWKCNHHNFFSQMMLIRTKSHKCFYTFWERNSVPPP